jgi:hypothetical protein
LQGKCDAFDRPGASRLMRRPGPLQMLAYAAVVIFFRRECAAMMM